MNRRILILFIAGAVIVILCAYKVTRTYKKPTHVVLPTVKQAAPPFELYNEKHPNELFRLAGYLGRHRILVLFFDGKTGADRDPMALRLRDEFDRLRKNNIKVLAVSAALPQENRKVIQRSGPFPFPLLSDPDLRVHRLWGRIDEHSGRPQTGLFLIDRAGKVDWADGSPRPLTDPKTTVDELIAGRK